MTVNRVCVLVIFVIKLKSILQPQSMMFPGLHPAAMMSVQGMGLAGVAGGPQQGAGAPQSAAAGSGFASHAGQTGGPSPASAGGGHSHGHSNGWGRPHGGPNHAANAGMFNGSGQRHQPPSNHHAAAAAAPMNPFAAAAAMAPQVNLWGLMNEGLRSTEIVLD